MARLPLSLAALTLSVPLAAVPARPAPVSAGRSSTTKATAPGQAVLPPEVRRKLLEAVGFPSIALSFGVELRREALLQDRTPRLEPGAQARILEREVQEHPEDAARWRRLGATYQDLGQYREARKPLERAVELAKKQAEETPGEWARWVELGAAHAAAGDAPAAETAYRRATEAAPAEWKSWTTLGSFLGGRAVAWLTWDKEKDGGPRPDATRLTNGITAARQPRLLEQLLQSHPDAEQLDHAQRHLDEAQACFRKAADLQPGDAAFYMERWGFRMMHVGTTGAALRLFREEARKPAATSPLALSVRQSLLEEGLQGAARAAMMNPDALDDLRQLARLRPEDVRVTLAATIMYALGSVLETGRDVPPGSPNFWQSLPAERRAHLQEHIDQLERLSRGADPRLAAEASEALAIISEGLKGDTPGTIPHLQRAVRQDPSRAKAWTMLVGNLAKAGRSQELQTLYPRLRATGGGEAQTWLLYARLHFSRGKLAQAEGDIAQALKREAQGMDTNLARVALLLSKNTAPALKEAGERLEQHPLTPSSDPEERADYHRLKGVRLALMGRLPEARKELEQALDPNLDGPDAEKVEKARRALAALKTLR